MPPSQPGALGRETASQDQHQTTRPPLPIPCGPFAAVFTFPGIEPLKPTIMVFGCHKASLHLYGLIAVSAVIMRGFANAPQALVALSDHSGIRGTRGGPVVGWKRGGSWMQREGVAERQSGVRRSSFSDRGVGGGDIWLPLYWYSSG